jgi:hypothetical protein
MNTWLQDCDDVRQVLWRFTEAMDSQCAALFAVYDELSLLEKKADNNESGAIFCGLCAYAYRAAGLIKLVDSITTEIMIAVDKLPTTGRGVKKKIINHQALIQELSERLQQYRNDTMHLAREITVMIEHPYVAADRSFYSHLQPINDALDVHMEAIDEMLTEIENHPVMVIDTSSIGALKVIHKIG